MSNEDARMLGENLRNDLLELIAIVVSWFVYDHLATLKYGKVLRLLTVRAYTVKKGRDSP